MRGNFSEVPNYLHPLRAVRAKANNMGKSEKMQCAEFENTLKLEVIGRMFTVILCLNEDEILF